MAKKKTEVKDIDITKTGPMTYRDLQNANQSQYTNLSPEFQSFSMNVGAATAPTSLYDARAHAEQEVQSPLNRTSTPWGESMFDEPTATEEQFQELGDIRAKNQPWYAKIGAGLAKGAVLAGTTFLDGTIGLVLGAGEAARRGFDDNYTKSGAFAGFWDNDFSKAMQKINEASEDILPNYYTRAEQEQPWWENIFTANFLGDKFIKNLGFSVGALYSGGVTAAGLKATKLPQLIGAITKSSKAPAIVTSAVGAITSAVNEGRIEALNNGTDWFNTQKAILDDNYHARIQALQEEYEANKGTLVQAADGSMVDPAWIEYQNVLKKEKETYNAALGKLSEDRLKMGNMDLLFNIPILTASNLVQFGKMYANGFKTERRLNNIVGRAGETKAATTKLGAATAITKGALAEGNEEISQKAASVISGKYYETDVNNYYKAKTDRKSEQETLSWTKAFASGINETVNDASSWEEFAIGALTGFMGIPKFRGMKNAEGKWQSPITIEGGAYNEWRDYQEKIAREQKIADYMNERFNSPEFKNYYQSLIRHNKYQGDMNRAAEDGDEFSFKNAEHAQLVSDISMYDNAGRLEDLYTLIDASYDTSDENLRSIVENTTTTLEDGSKVGPFVDNNGNPMYATPEGKQQMIDKLSQNRDDLMNTINNYLKIKNKLDTKVGQQLTDDQLEELTWMQSQLDNWAGRAKDMSKDVKTAISGILADLNNMLSFQEAVRDQQGRDNADLTDLYKQADENIKLIKSVINNLDTARGYSDDRLAYTLATNPKFSEYLVEQIKNLDNGILSESEKEDIANKIQDIIKLGKASEVYENKLSEYLKNPEKQAEDHARADEEREEQETKEKNDDLKAKLNNAKNLQEFRAVVNDNLDDIENLNSVLDEMADDGNELAGHYRETSQYNNEIKRAINESDADAQTKQDALKLFQDQFNNSENLPQLAYPNSVYINNENAFDEDSGGDVDLSASRFQEAQYELQKAMSKVNNNNKFKDRFSNEYKRPVNLRAGETAYQSKTGAIVYGKYEKTERDGYTYYNYKGRSPAKHRIKPDSDISLEEIIGTKDSYYDPNLYDEVQKEAEEEGLAIDKIVIRPNGTYYVEFSDGNGTVEGEAAKKIFDKLFNREIKGDDRTTTGDSQTTTTPTVTTSENVSTTETPTGNITPEMVAEENRSANSRIEMPARPKQGESKKYYRPAIPELHIEASKEGDFRAFDVVVREKEGANFEEIYNYLRDKGAFDYLNSGKLKVGATLGFMIDPEFEKRVEGQEWHKAPTIFIIDKSNGQVVGSLDEGASMNRFEGLAALEDRVRKEYEESKKAKPKDSTLQGRSLRKSFEEVGLADGEFAGNISSNVATGNAKHLTHLQAEIIRKNVRRVFEDSNSNRQRLHDAIVSSERGTSAEANVLFYLYKALDKVKEGKMTVDEAMALLELHMYVDDDVHKDLISKLDNSNQVTSNQEELEVSNTAKPKEDLIHITNTSNGLQHIGELKEWSKKTGDVRKQPDGWGTYNGLTYYKFSQGGRGGDNVTIWFNEKPNVNIEMNLQQAIDSSKDLNDLGDRIANLINIFRGTTQSTGTQSSNIIEFKTDYQYDKEMSFYSGQVHGTLSKVENGTAVYVDEKGQPTILLAGKSDHQFIGIFREPNSDKWSIKMENKEGDKSIFKAMMSSVMAQLPIDARLYERTNISVDGLRVFAQQLNHGFTTSSVFYRTRVNGGDLANVFGVSKEDAEDMTPIKMTEKDLPKAQQILKPYLEKLGVVVTNSTISIDDEGYLSISLPYLRKSVDTNRVESTKKPEASKPKQGKFIATPTTNVSKIMVGRVPYGNKENNLKDIPGVSDNGQSPVFGIIKNGVLTTNGKVSDRQLIKPVDMSNEGRLYLLIPNGAGKYSPAAVRVKHFNSEEFDINASDVASTPMGSDIKAAITELTTANSQDDVSKAMKNLSQDLHMQDVMITWFSSKAGDGIVISKKVRKSDGTYEKVIINGKEQIKEDKYDVYFSTSKKTADVNGIELDESALSASEKAVLLGVPKDPDAIYHEILSIIKKFNLPLQVSTRRINSGAYNNRLLNSNILTSNITEATTKSTWFTTDYFDKDGNLQKAVNPASVAPKPTRKIETPVGGTESAISGTKVVSTFTKKPYYVDLKNNTIKDEQGNSVAITPQNAILLDLAWAQNNFGNAMNSVSMIDGKFVTPDGKVVDKVRQVYLEGKDAQDVKDAIEGKKNETKERIAKSKEVVGEIYENQKRVDKTRTDSDFYYIQEDDGEYHQYSRVHSRLGSNWIQSKKQEDALKDIRVKLSKLSNDASQYKNYLTFLENKHKIDLNAYKNTIDAKSRDSVVNIVRDSMAGTNSQRALNAGSAVDSVIRQFFTIKDTSKITRPSNMSESAYVDLITKLNEIKSNMEQMGETFLTDNIVLFQKYPDGTRVAGEVDILSVDKDGNFRIYDVKTSRYSFHEFTDRYGHKLNYFDNPSPTQRMSTKDYYSLQLSAYKNLFESQYGVPVTKLAVMPFVLSYDKDTVASITSEKGIPITYNPAVNVPLVGNVRVDKPKVDNPSTVAKTNVAPVFETSLETQNPIEDLSDDHKMSDNDKVGYFEMEGKLHKGFLKRLTTIDGIDVYMTRTPNYTKGLSNESRRLASYNYYAVFPNGKVFLFVENNSVKGENSFTQEKIESTITSGLSNNPKRVKDMANEKTLLFDPNDVPPTIPPSNIGESNVGESTESTSTKAPTGGAALMAQKEQAINEHDEEFEDDLILRRRTDEKKDNTWDRRKELKWLEKVLPQLSAEDRVKVVKGLIEVGSRGTKAWGQFDKGIVTLSDIAAEGTTYHEAFHVVFNLLLDSKERQALYEEAKRMYGDKDNLSLEEDMAEGFREYVTTRQNAGLLGKIKNFFKDLWIKVTNWNSVRPHLLAYYQMINEGKYSGKELPISTISQDRVRQGYTQEMNDILNNANRDSTGNLLAPNGKKSNLSERQYAHVRTKAFKDWFGDWENNPNEASKVVDENGEPLVVYHGSSDNSFTVFDRSKNDKSYKGFFFTDSNIMASSYGKNPRGFFINSRNPYEIEGHNKNWADLKVATSEIAKDKLDAIRLYKNNLTLKLKEGEASQDVYDFWNDKFFKPLEEYKALGNSIKDRIKKVILARRLNKFNAVGDFVKSTRNAEKILELDKEDVGITFNNIMDYGALFSPESALNIANNKAANVYVVTNPNNIKSATENIGTYSNTNNDVRYRKVPNSSFEVLPQEAQDNLLKKGWTREKFNSISQEERDHAIKCIAF